MSSENTVLFQVKRKQHFEKLLTKEVWIIRVLVNFRYPLMVTKESQENTRDGVPF